MYKYTFDAFSTDIFAYNLKILLTSLRDLIARKFFANKSF